MNSDIPSEVGLDVMEGPDLDNGPCGKAPLNGYAKWCVSSVHLPFLFGEFPRSLFEPNLSEVSLGQKIALSYLLCLTLIMCQPKFRYIFQSSDLLGPKLVLVMGCVKLGEKNCVHLPSVGEQTAN